MRISMVVLLSILLAACASFSPGSGSPTAITILEDSSTHTPVTSSPFPTRTIRPTIWYTPSPRPTITIFITPNAMQLAHWKEYDKALASVIKHLTPPEKVLCEWIVLGFSKSAIYVWALCAEHLRNDFYPSVSVPAIIHINLDGEVVGVETPEAGMNYGPSIRRMFPEDVQEKIFHFQEWLDVEQLKTHLIYRFEHPGTPPLIVLSATPMP